MSDTNRERAEAVRKAWKNERGYVRDGKGTRDWLKPEQRQILAKGRASGYEGHHMKSVKDYPQYAGSPDNIQFLNRSEHIKGAHKGNTQNSTNGYYDHKTGIMHDFGNRAPQAPQPQALTSPLTQRQNKSQSAQRGVIPTDKPTVNRGIESMRNRTNAQKSSTSNAARAAQNKGIEAAKQKMAAKQSTQAGSSVNQGIKNYQNKISGNAAAGSAKATGSSAGKSSGSGKGSSR